MHYRIEEEGEWEKNENDKEEKEEANKKGNKTSLRCLRICDDGMLLTTMSDTSNISEGTLNFINFKNTYSVQSTI
jgi:hypothetical protein